MSAPLMFLTALPHCLLTVGIAFFGLGRLVLLAVRPRAALAAENIFLRRQLALFQERKVKPRRANDATRWLMATVSRLFDCRTALVVVKPDTLIRWHRKGFRLFWRRKSSAPGRPPIPADLRQLIATMATANRTWGEERITAELPLKLGIRISPRTVRRYMPSRTPRGTTRTQTWSTFIRNHAQTILACDF